MTPIHQDFVDPFHLTVYYIDDGPGDVGPSFRVVVEGAESRKESTVPCMYPPKFGIDAVDMQTIHEEAEKLCREMES